MPASPSDAAPSGRLAGRLAERIAAFERSARLLGLIKLGNAGLTMIWGFAVTYVFVRAVPLHEFKAFLLLVAFSNFTVSAEFGLTNIIYSRLRRYWIDPDPAPVQAPGAFRREELGVLFFSLLLLIVAATVALGIAIAGRIVPTAMPMLFLLFFLLACLNVIGLLAKRALAAIDHNFVWELLDGLRRVLVLGLLLAVLVGLDLRLAVALQLLVSMVALGFAVGVIHKRLGMRAQQWLALRVGGGHVRRHYLRDFTASALLTASEITAYNAPYFTIALATGDARPMLLFDFMFKMSRALAMVVRAMIEAALPRLTSSFYERRADRFRQLLRRALTVAIVAAVAAGLLIALAGPWLVDALFNGKLVADRIDMGLLALMLAALSVTCVSVYLQGALGRFARLLRQSLPFLAGSLLSVPLAAGLAGPLDMSFARLFMLFYAATFTGTALLHIVSLRRLARDVSAG